MLWMTTRASSEVLHACSPVREFSQTQFGVVARPSMNDQNDLARRLVDIDDDLVDQGAHQFAGGIALVTL